MEYVDLLVKRYPSLIVCREDILKAFNILKMSFLHNKKLLIAGNGGSAADAQHIVGELMKGFKKKRKISESDSTKFKMIEKEMGTELSLNLQRALPAIALDGHSALSTAYLNDCSPLLCFAQQVYGYGNEGDVLLAISTSGNSSNILYAAVTAKAKGMKIIGLTGERNNELSKYADVCIHAPESETYKVQELHLPIYHCLCLMLEEEFFSE